MTEKTPEVIGMARRELPGNLGMEIRIARRISRTRKALESIRASDNGTKWKLYALLAEAAKLQAYLNEHSDRPAALKRLAARQGITQLPYAHPVLLLFKMLGIAASFPPATAARHARTVAALSSRGLGGTAMEEEMKKGAQAVLAVNGRRRLRRRPRMSSRRPINRKRRNR